MTAFPQLLDQLTWVSRRPDPYHHTKLTILVPTVKIFPPTLEIGPDEGFDPQKDIFGRASIGVGLGHLLDRVEDPMTLVIDGEWGTGKTVFLKMLSGHLRKQGFRVINFDAFENDYLTDAFTSIASVVIDSAKTAPAGPLAAFVNRATDVSRLLLRSGIKTGIKVATLGALSSEDLDEVGKSIAEGLSEAEDKTLGELLTQKRQRDETISAFKKSLIDLRLAGLGDQDRPKAIIIIIDELDRCKPVFALEILERIKHVFSTKGVHFVLGANLNQLANSVSFSYGSGIDGRKYLQKFISMTYTLADTSEYRGERLVSKYVSYLSHSMAPGGGAAEAWRYSTEHVSEVAHRLDLSFREIDKVFTTLALALATATKSRLAPAPLIGGLAVLKVIEPKLFNMAKRGTLTLASVAKALEIPISPADSESFPFDEMWWRYALDETPPEHISNRFKDVEFRYNVYERARLIPLLANGMIDRLSFN